MFFDKTLVLGGWMDFALVDFLGIEAGGIIRKSSLSLFNIFVVSLDLVFLLAMFFLLLLFLFLLDSFSLLNLLV